MKKKKSVSKRTNSSYNDEMIRTAKIFAGVLLVIGIVYLITALATGELKLGKNKTTKEPVSIQYEEIIAGQILNRKEDNYYVLLFKFTDNKATQLLALKDNYKNLSKKNIYIVDLDKSFNSQLIKQEDEKVEDTWTSLKNIKVEETTILEIKDKKVIKKVFGSDNVIKFIEGLIK